jgi:hypothetical protein
MYTGSGKGLRARVARREGSRFILTVAGLAKREVDVGSVLVLPLPASTSSFFAKHVVGFNERIGEGFLDPGRLDAALFPTLDALSRRHAGAAGTREVLIVDTRVDDALFEFVVDAITSARNITGTREQLKFLGELVSERLGGVSSSIVEDCEKELAERMLDKDSPLVKLGDVRYGVCRHRALLFKVLGDAMGLDCALVRGTFGGAQGAGGHAWNVVYLYGSPYVVDAMHRPGEI